MRLGLDLGPCRVEVGSCAASHKQLPLVAGSNFLRDIVSQGNLYFLGFPLPELAQSHLRQIKVKSRLL